MSVEEGAVESLQFCLTVTEFPGYIFGDFLVESLPVGSATGKSNNKVDEERVFCCMWCICAYIIHNVLATLLTTCIVVISFNSGELMT